MIFCSGLHASLPRKILIFFDLKLLNFMPYFSLNVYVYEMILKGCMSLAYENVAFGELIHGGGGGLVITLIPIVHPLLHFPGQRQNHFSF